MTTRSEKIESLLKEADECEMLGGLAPSHDERVAYRQRADVLRSLVLEAQILLDQSEARMKAPQMFLPDTAGS